MSGRIFSFFGLCLLFLITSPRSDAQSAYSIGGSMHKGFIFKHTDEIGHLANSHPTGFEIYVKKHTYGKKLWQQLHHYPDIGLGIIYFDFKNPILGKSIAAITFMDFYLKRNPSSEALFKIGLGINYATNPYDRENNNKNIALGSTLSYAIQGKFSYHLKISDRLKATSALTITHFSNGAITKPNKGINIPSASLGLLYTLKNERPFYIYTENIPDHNKQIKLNITLASGIKEIEPLGSGRYPFFTLSSYIDKQIRHNNALNIGLDAFYSIATKEEVKVDKDLPEGEDPDFKRLGLVIGHELFVSRLSLITQLGIYLYRPYKADQPVYQRYGLKYYFNNKYYAKLALKSHYGKADAVEWGVGIRL